MNIDKIVPPVPTGNRQLLRKGIQYKLTGACRPPFKGEFYYNPFSVSVVECGGGNGYPNVWICVPEAPIPPAITRPGPEQLIQLISGVQYKLTGEFRQPKKGESYYNPYLPGVTECLAIGEGGYPEVWICVPERQASSSSPTPPVPVPVTAADPTTLVDEIHYRLSTFTHRALTTAQLDEINTIINQVKTLRATLRSSTNKTKKKVPPSAEITPSRLAPTPHWGELRKKGYVFSAYGEPEEGEFYVNAILPGEVHRRHTQRVPELSEFGRNRWIVEKW